MPKKKRTKKKEEDLKVDIKPVEKEPKVIKIKFYENEKVKLLSLKNQLLADGTFVEKNELVEVTQEYANRLLSLSKPSYKKA